MSAPLILAPGMGMLSILGAAWTVWNLRESRKGSRDYDDWLLVCLHHHPTGACGNCVAWAVARYAVTLPNDAMKTRSRCALGLFP